MLPEKFKKDKCLRMLEPVLFLSLELLHRLPGEKERRIMMENKSEFRRANAISCMNYVMYKNCTWYQNIFLSSNFLSWEKMSQFYNFVCNENNSLLTLLKITKLPHIHCQNYVTWRIHQRMSCVISYLARTVSTFR